MDLLKKLRGAGGTWVSRLFGTQTLAAKDTGVDSGISFVGSPDSSSILWLGDSGARPDADDLTRALALATSAYCYTAVAYRWRTVSEPPLGVVVERDGELEKLDNHRLALLLAEPSADYDMGELAALTEAYLLVTGAALWVKGEDGAGLVPFSGDQFRTESADNRIFGRFLVTTDGGEKRVAPEDVVFFREINPNSWRSNLSKLDVALSMLDLGHQVARTVRNYMRQAMFPGGVISPDPEWNPNEDEFQTYTSRIKAWHAGPSKAGEPLVLLGGSKFSDTALSLRELLPSELLNRIEATVGSVFGIPPVVLGWLVGLENSPWSQMSEARRMTYEDTIEPRWRELEKRMTRQLLTPAERVAGQHIRFDTSEIRALRADDAARADTAGKVADIWTVNERRTYTGKEPLEDERGEELGGGGGGGAFGNEPVVEEEGEEGKADLLVSRLARDPDGLAWVLFDANCKAAEASWEREIFGALETQQKDILRLSRKYLEEAKGTDQNSADRFVDKTLEYLENEGTPELLKLVYPLIYSTGKQAVRKVAAKVQVSFSILEEALAGYAERESAFLATVMGDTTGKAVAGAVQKSLDAGELLTDLRKRLETLPAFNRKRAKLTARTETTRAWNGSQRASLSKYQNDTGRQVFKTWLSSRDDRVRDEHIELDGKQLPVDGVFENGLKEPGEPNCRCTLIYSLADNTRG